jgi:hypothetical protein
MIAMEKLLHQSNFRRKQGGFTMGRSLVAGILGLMTTLAFASVMAAQAPASVPNLSGVWSRVGNATFDPSDPEGLKAADLSKYPMTAWGQAQFKANRPAHGAAQNSTYGEGQTTGSNDPVNRCLPPGIPRVYVGPQIMQIVQTADHLVELFEYDSLFRIIYLNGRERPKDLEKTYMGWSNGHWEGDTLVVTATGFNGKGWLDRVGHPYSDELQLQERFHLVDAKTLQDDLTFHDPKAYTRDWTGQKIFKLRNDWFLGDYFCEDQGQFDEYQKKAGFNSFLPKQ